MKALRILLDNQQEKIITTEKIHKKTELILNALGYNTHEISIVITDNDGIKQLNENYRGISKPTNVLSFPMLEGDFSQINPELLGDIVISAETAKQEADEAKITLDERISQLLIHGILHLVGFDHEKSDDGLEEMEKKSIELLRIVEKNSTLEAF